MSDEKSKKKKRGHHEGGLYQRKDGKWCGAISLGQDSSGRRRRKVFVRDTKAEAKDAMQKEQLRIAGGGSIDPSNATLGLFMEEWLEKIVKHTTQPNTYRAYEISARVHVLGTRLAKMKLRAITPLIIQAFYAELADNGISGRVREGVHLVLSMALDVAQKQGHIVANPCAVVDKPRREKREMKVWDQTQAIAFMNEARQDRLWALYALAISTGISEGELFGLKWTDIDLDAKTVSVQRSLVEIAGKITEGPPKTKNRLRRIDLPELAVEALKKHRRLMLAEGNAAATYVFCDTEGGPLRKSNMTRRSFYRLIEQAGVTRIRFHDLRHTCATLLLKEGVHPKVVQERLGHANISVTLDIYSHVLPGMQRDASDRIDGVLKPRPTLKKK